MKDNFEGLDNGVDGAGGFWLVVLVIILPILGGLNCRNDRTGYSASNLPEVQRQRCVDACKQAKMEFQGISFSLGDHPPAAHQCFCGLPDSE